MKILYRNKSSNWNQKLLCITHADRPVDRERCNLNFLETRYSSPHRLPPLEPFEALTPSIQHTPYLGEVTIWEFIEGDYRRPQLVAQIRPTSYKPQFAIWHKQRLWILGVEELVIYDSNFSRLAVVQDPWLAGAHTIIPDQKGHLLVSCSASDSILVIDDECYEVIKTIRMPEALYGFNYSLSRMDSVVDHYIINDYQLTHINCAWPLPNGILVSTLIQGAIGRFDETESYQELLRGFVGCHGARTDQRTNQIYFCDSCLGAVTFLTSTYNIDYRVDAGSIWLHDAQQLDNHYFALSVADRNQIEIVDFSSRAIISILPGGDFGSSTQFVYYGG